MGHNEILTILNNSYNLKFNSLELLRKGGCISFCALSGDKKYFLKIITGAFMDTAKQSLNILIYLEEKGFPVPKIILTKDGLPFIEDKDNDIGCKTIYVLFDFIEGREPEEGEDVEYIGELVGQLHNIMGEYKGSLPEHNKDFFIDRYLNILKRKNYDDSKIKQFRHYGDILWERVEKLPRSFCHGDLHRGNLLKTSTGKYYFLDFDTSCIAFPTYDIMIMCNATNYFEFDEKGYEKAKNTYHSFLKGYLKHCNLSDLELKTLYDFIAIYHYQLQATIIEINGLDCVDERFLDEQLNWLIQWRKQCDEYNM